MMSAAAMSVHRRLSTDSESMSGEESSSSEEEHSVPSRSSTPPATFDVEKYMKRAQGVVSDLQASIDRVQDLYINNYLDKWRPAAISLGRDAPPPACTIIGVVGESGHGKSSLLNALLDHEDILPTSAMEACTAVAIEVSDNKSRKDYEAHIEFISKEEWKNELEALLRTTKSQPEYQRTTESQAEDLSSTWSAHGQSAETQAGWAKVRAVYGEFGSLATLEQLLEPSEVTEHLGTVIDIVEREVDAFCDRVDQYVKASADGKDGAELWPVIKRVSIRIPDCKLCRDGTILVDLPGSCDSNAARSNLAEEYLEKCSHVLVVSDIVRATTSKTVKDFLRDHLRRQFDMDSQFQNIIMVCTKSDNIETSSGIEREINQIQEDLSAKIESHKAAIQRFVSEKDELDSKCKAVKLLELSTSIRTHRRSLKLVRAKARNEFVRKNITSDFRNIINEMRSDADSEKKSNMDHMAQNLQVFCVSSLDYKALTVSGAGEPKVYKEATDTEIPRLKEFLHMLGAEPKRRLLGQLLRSLRQLLLDLKVMLEQKTEICGQIERQAGTLHQVINTTSDKYQCLCDKILSNIGTSNGQGKSQAADVSKKWRSLHNAGTRKSGRLKRGTHRISHHCKGVGRSTATRLLDFSEKHSRPLHRENNFIWGDILNVKMVLLLDDFSLNLYAALSQIGKKLEQLCFGEKASRLEEGYLQPVHAKVSHHADSIKVCVARCKRDVGPMSNTEFQADIVSTLRTCVDRLLLDLHAPLNEFLGNAAALAEDIDGLLASVDEIYKEMNMVSGQPHCDGLTSPLITRPSAPTSDESVGKIEQPYNEQLSANSDACNATDECGSITKSQCTVLGNLEVNSIDDGLGETALRPLETNGAAEEEEIGNCAKLNTSDNLLKRNHSEEHPADSTHYKRLRCTTETPPGSPRWPATETGEPQPSTSHPDPIPAERDLGSILPDIAGPMSVVMANGVAVGDVCKIDGVDILVSDVRRDNTATGYPLRQGTLGSDVISNIPLSRLLLKKDRHALSMELRTRAERRKNREPFTVTALC